MSAAFEKITDTYEGFKPFSSNKYVEGGKEFLTSNSLVAKFAFLILVLVLFIILLRLGASLLSWIFLPSGSPILLNGISDGQQQLIIETNPAESGSIPIIRSVNQNGGIEFTWSVWLLANSPVFGSSTAIQNVFFKGDLDKDGTTIKTQAPNMQINPENNSLIITMDTISPDATQTKDLITIPNLPRDKWVNVLIRLSNQTQLDVYINGVLTRRSLMDNVVNQNYDKVFIALNGGFPGKISSLRYFNIAIGTNHIQSIVESGPNMTIISKDNTASSSSDNNQYLSTRWYFGN